MKQALLSGMALMLVLNVFSQEGEPYMVKNFCKVKAVKATTAGGETQWRWNTSDNRKGRKDKSIIS